VSEALKPLSWYRDLAEASGRRAAGCFIIEGERAVRQAAGAQPGAVLELLASGPVPPDLAGYPVRELTERQFKSVSGSVTPQGLLAVAKLPEDFDTDTLPEPPGDRILLLEQVQDPGNTGTLIRTAAAFGYDGIVLSSGCADPFSPKVVQAAAGTVLSVWTRRTAKYLSLARELQERGGRLVGTALDGDEDAAVLRAEKLVLALGNEAHGLSEELRTAADAVFRLPVARERAESLNVAVAGGICLYLGRREGLA
jgi:TrmH family RNA methyltransferase